MTSLPQDSQLDTLKPSGKPPSSRVSNPDHARSILSNMLLADRPRSEKRRKVKGIVDGNPPYRNSDLTAAGRSQTCNVNWRIAESYLLSAIGAFYDLFSEAPTYAEIKTAHGTSEQQSEWSEIITHEFDRLQKRDASFDYHMQISQYEMVLYGIGPLWFEDRTDWRCRSSLCRQLLVMDGTKSDTSEWELASNLVDYLPHQLFDKIKDGTMAGRVGWKEQAVRRAIMQACPIQDSADSTRSWEWYQDQLKTSSFQWNSSSNMIQTGHMLWQEFDGKISHAIVLRGTAEDAKGEFLYHKVGRYQNWSEVVHPMYYDHCGGGLHHAVTGMGVKMYSAMEYQNRLLCNLADKAFSPKMLFKPTTADQSQKFALANMGDGALLPPGYDVAQVAVNGLLNDGLAFNRELSLQISANLSQYRQNLTKETGNPLTATGEQIRASQQASLGKTQLARYYAQLDRVYAEKFRRASNPNLTDGMPGGKAALEFQERCKKAGVPKVALQHIESVLATRVAGQGSLYLRQQSLEFLLGLVSMLPEEGRLPLIRDVVAARVGWSGVSRYGLGSKKAEQATDQHATAMLQVSSMKQGIPAVVTANQNAVIFAQTFLQAGAQALQSVQAGANPAEVAVFLELIGQATAAHLQRMSGDPSRKVAFDALQDQWKQMASQTDQVLQMAQQASQEQAEQGAGGAGQADPEMVMKMEKAKLDMQLKAAKTQQAMDAKQKAAEQKLAINDLMTAQKVRRGNAKQGASE